MLYAILCYSSELEMSSWTRQQEEALLERRRVIVDELDKHGRVAAVARLMPTTTATTVRAGSSEPVVLDGPFAETKEQLLGFYVVECDTLEQAIEIGRGFVHDAAALEVRPIRAFRQGVLK